MVLLILGIAIAIFLMAIGIKKDKFVWGIVAVIIGGSLISVAISVPSGKYSEWKTAPKEQLIPLYLDETENTKYLVETGTGYMFRRTFPSVLGTTENNLEDISFCGLWGERNMSIEVFESKEITEPYLIIRHRYYEGSIWTFPEKEMESKYTFYVPPGTTITMEELMKSNN